MNVLDVGTMKILVHFTSIILDHNKYNSAESNLIVLCANCHSSLHHGIWKLEDYGVDVNITEFKYAQKYSKYAWCNKTTERAFLSQIKDLNEIIRDCLYLNKLNRFEYSYESLILRELNSAMIEYAYMDGFNLGENLTILNNVFHAYVYSIVDGIEYGWQGYNANDDIIKIVKKHVNKIKSSLLEKKHFKSIKAHDKLIFLKYADLTPSEDEMTEVTATKPII